MEQLDKLKVKRGQIKAALTRFQNYLKSPECDHKQVTHRRDKAEENWKNFEQIQAAIEELTIDSEEETDNYRIEVENLYFESMAEAEQRINSEKAKVEEIQDNRGNIDSRNSYSGESACSASSIIKLAALNIPIFNGDYAEWATFHDMYIALIHTNSSLTGIQKFFYLRSSLGGDAANCIKNLETTADQYECAWKALVGRYNNKKFLVQSHVQGIYELESVSGNSVGGLRKLADTLRGHMAALETLEQRPNDWGPLLTHIIRAKLDESTLSAWEAKTSKTEVAKVHELITFLDERSELLEAIESSKNIAKGLKHVTVENYKIIKDKKGKFNRNNIVCTSLTAATDTKCYVCNLPHTIYKCPSFVELSPIDRIKKVNELNLCKICLRKHDLKRCTSRNNCFKCNKAHNTLLHIFQRKGNEEKREVQNTDQPSTSSVTTAHVVNEENILLSTAVIRAISANAKSVLCRALLDSGSQCNFITEELVQSLQLKKSKTIQKINGIGSTTQNAYACVNARFESRFNNYNLTLKMFVVPKITGNLPSKNITKTYNIPNNIKLADPLYYSPQKVDILIGATHFYDIIMNQKIKPIVNGPVFQETEFGWIVSGPIPTSDYKGELIINTYQSAISYNDSILENLIPLFWRIEEFGGNDPYTIEEKACREHFDNTIARGNDGRFIVQLPFRDKVSNLGSSYEIAKRRLLSLERRFVKNAELKKDYIKFINEYLELGHMEAVDIDDNEEIGKSCYLPHHAIIKESSTSTRLRVVFDASCKTDSGRSLNDVLLKGPVLQDDLLFILTRFRKHNYVLSADITKMYRQFWVADEHRPYQRILWRENSSEPIKIFQLKTITYGTVSASFLATGCLEKLAETEHMTNPDVSASITRDFYMDDFLGGSDTLESAIKLRDGLINVLRSAGLELRKWSSNNDNLIPQSAQNNNPSEREVISIRVHENDKNMTKVLGLLWSPSMDALRYDVADIYFGSDNSLTKRDVLSDIARLFDPLGLVGPIVIRAKLILQRLWRLKVQWDEPLPDDVQEDWKKYRLSLTLLNKLIIPRKITCGGDIIDVQIHGFSDASIEAYGCCLYLRCTNADGLRSSILICAKSKVAPLKVISLPKLELCAALLLSRLASKVVPKLCLVIKKSYFWTDSNIVLAWISSPSTKWKTFVAHRVGEIQESTSISDWHHVNTKENPADIISRGCCPSYLFDAPLWWNGPEWLLTDEEKWTNIKNTESSSLHVPESKGSEISVFGVAVESFSILNKYSSLNKLIHVVAYCLRFYYKIIRKEEELTNILSIKEIDRARITIIKCVQKEAFTRELQDLKNLKGVAKSSKLFSLCPFLDENNIIRVGGRLKNAASIDVFQRHPIVLPAKCHFTSLLFKSEHERCMHGGPQATLNSIRLTYWPINGRNIARNTIHQCVTCFRYKPIVVQPIMGDLPVDRVTSNRAFLKCGIDFAGPFLIKTNLRRNSPIVKAYVCIFVCFATKATHIELVGDLSTTAFINALNRFFDRRGKSVTIYTDNATNFVGANRKLKEWYNFFQCEPHMGKINEMLVDANVQWRFIPPRSPHFGGLWEASVKSMKHLVQKTLGEARLTYEELYTVLTRAEACLNSRPVTPMSSDPNDLSVLTPGHFLIGEPLLAVPEPDLSAIPINRLTRWRRVSQYSRYIWQKWSREYLSQLQERKKWAGERGPKLKVGTVVLIRDENLPPLRWRLGRVQTITSGGDGVIRVAEVRTVGGTYSRAVRQLCPLPFEGNVEDP